MRDKLLLILTLFLAAGLPGAVAQDKKTLKLNAVDTQEVQMQYGYSLEEDCTPHPMSRIAILKPPRGGKVTMREIELFPRYGSDNVRHPCNKTRTKAVAAFYQAQPKFRGTDRFSFAIVYYDGTARVYETEVVVWGGAN